VGKKVDGALVQGFLYKEPSALRPYRFIKDQGSVRLVLDALPGDVAQEVEYDEFGVVTSDGNPGAVPRGYWINSVWGGGS
jgi:hypothetical protein